MNPTILFIRIAIIAFPFLLAIYFNQASSLLASADLIEKRYVVYLNNKAGGSESRVAVYLADLIIILLRGKRVREHRFFMACGVYTLVLQFLAYYSRYLWRISDYFLLGSTVFVAMYCMSLDGGAVGGPSLERGGHFPNASKYWSSKRWITVAVPWFMIALAAALWVFEIVVIGSHETYPYASEIIERYIAL